MAFLEQFSPEEQGILVSLPYRAGLWISTIDRSGGGDSGAAEIAVLETVIAQKAQGMFESAFVHEIMVETCTRRSDWPAWAAKTQGVPDDCAKATAIIAAKLPARDLDAYRENVMYIAVEVAKAFREFDTHQSLLSLLWEAVRSGLDFLSGMARAGAHESGPIRNISFEEDVALDKLSKMLGVTSSEEQILDEAEA